LCSVSDTMTFGAAVAPVGLVLLSVSRFGRRRENDWGLRWPGTHAAQGVGSTYQWSRGGEAR
jgi:hypothetical protein